MLGRGKYSVCLESGCTRQWVTDTQRKIIHCEVHGEAVGTNRRNNITSHNEVFQYEVC